MKVKSGMQRMAALIEFIVGATLAIVFHFVLEDAVAAFTIFGVGLLLSLSTWLLREDVIEIRERLLAEYREFHELPDALRRIEDPECLRKARESITRVASTLALLQRGFIPLDQTEFMLEATKAADGTQRTLKSVSSLAAWEMRGAVLKYYQANKRAAERGVKISRTFVLRRGRTLDAEVQKILETHRKDGIEVKVLYRDELPAGEAGWTKDCSFNFEIYDDRLVVDVSAPPPYYGVKVCQRAELVRYHQMFNLIDHASAATFGEEECLLGA
jgi:hypothetical protein